MKKKEKGRKGREYEKQENKKKYGKRKKWESQR